MINTESISNLINGVSQQADDLRFASQGKEQINRYSTVAYGQGKRPATTYVSKMYEANVLTDNADGTPNEFASEILRTSEENYALVVRDGVDPKINVFDLLTTDVQNVTLEDPTDYLQCSNPAKDLRAITVADFTFLLNTTVTPQMTADVIPETTPAALVMVKRIERKADYTLRFYHDPSGPVTATVSVDDIDNNADRDPASGDPIATDQNAVLDLFNSQLASGGLADDYTWYYDRGVMYIKRTDGQDFRLEAECSVSDAFYVFKDEVESVALLPAYANVDFTIKVKPDSNAEEGQSYWVKYRATNENSVGLTTGSWEETIAPGSTYKIDPATMPHALVSEGNGEWTFRQIEWDDRLAGDEDSNADPSFIGNKITEIYFAKNRLQFLAGQGAITSESDQYFNFFRTTVISLLDTDRIDVKTNHRNVTKLTRAEVLNQEIILFSGRDQFMLKGGQDSFTPSNVSIEPISQTVFQIGADPVIIDNKMVFPFTRQNYSAYYEMEKTIDGVKWEATEITKHIPRYIDGKVLKTVVCDAENVLLSQTSGYEGVYVYKWYESNGELLQQSWSKFEFSNGSVRNFFVVDSWLYLVMEYSDGVYLERMTLVPADRAGNLDYSIHLDRQVGNDKILVNDLPGDPPYTVVTLPYTPNNDDDLVVIASGAIGEGNVPQVPILMEDGLTEAYFEDGTTVMVMNLGQALESGQQLPVAYRNGNIIYIEGLFEEVPEFTIGVTYRSRFKLSRPNVRDDNNAVLNVDRMQITKGRINVNDTVQFEVNVATRGREFRYRFGDFSGGDIIKKDAIFTFPIMAESRDLEIELINDSPYPANYINIDYDYRLRDRRRRR